MGGDEYSQSFRDKLEIEIEESYENYVKVPCPPCPSSSEGRRCCR